MESRFIILLPENPGEIFLATSVIRCLKTQVEDAQAYALIKQNYGWILEFNPFLDGIFAYEEHPMELLSPLKDFLPDYLIDLDGGRQVRRFKNRLKVLDFSISYRKFDQDQFLPQAFKTCVLFDVQDDGKGSELVANLNYQEILPRQFIAGYIVLALDSGHQPRPITDDQVIQLAVMTEKPMVVTGNAEDRDLANRISQAAGCAVFPTCGDLTKGDIASVFSHANGALVFDPLWKQAASALGISCLLVNDPGKDKDLADMALWARSLFIPENGRNTF